MRLAVLVFGILWLPAVAAAEDGPMTETAISAFLYSHVCKKDLVSKATMNAAVRAAARERNESPNDTVIYIASIISDEGQRLQEAGLADDYCASFTR